MKEDFLPEALLIAFPPLIVMLAFANIIRFDTSTFETLVSIGSMVSIAGLTAHILYVFKED